VLCALVCFVVLKLKRLMMKRKWITNSLLILVSLAVIRCSKEETTGIPTPTPPPGPTNNGGFDPTTPPNIDPRLPDLSKAVGVTLADSTTYSGLQDIATNVFLPLVGDSLVSMNLELGADSSLSGSLLFAFEDQLGFWGALLPSFPGTGQITGGMLDIIFSDDELVLRTVGSFSGDQLNGTIYYRVRQSGEDQCLPVTVTCELVITDPGDAWWYNPTPPDYDCDFEEDVVSPCRAYMNLSETEVKALGSFSAPFSNWVR